MNDAKAHAMRDMLVLATAFAAVTYGNANFAVAREFKIVVPNGFTDIEGDQRGVGVARTPFRSQEIFLASEFDELPPSYQWITAVATRPDENTLLPWSVEYGDLQYRLSTIKEDELTAAFAENVGLDEALVFDRSPFTISARDIPDLSQPGPRDFDYTVEFDTPFFYDPTTGRNLVIEVRSESGYLDNVLDVDMFSDSSGIFAQDVDVTEAPFSLSAKTVREFTFAPLLQAGDSDQDLDVDQLDLVQVQIAAKYLSGQAATWGEGDWNGAPGGLPGNPPAGDGLFNQLDIVAAQQAGLYLAGPYAAVSPGGQRADGQTSIIYRAGTGELAIDAPAGLELTSINIDSAAGIFTGIAAQNLGGSFDNDADTNIFKATFGGTFGSASFGNVAQAGLTEEFLLSDLSVVGSLAGDGDLGDVDLVYVPEPSTALLVAVGLVIGVLRFRRKSQ